MADKSEKGEWSVDIDLSGLVCVVFLGLIILGLMFGKPSCW